MPFTVIIKTENTVSRASVALALPPSSAETMKATSITVTASVSTSVP